MRNAGRRLRNVYVLRRYPTVEDNNNQIMYQVSISVGKFTSKVPLSLSIILPFAQRFK
jgi:hypothetical protein